MSKALAIVAAPESDTDLVARCLGGDQTAFRALYVTHAPSVQGWARRLGTPPSELDDVLQEVFLRAYKALGHFTHGAFAHWLFRLCANVVTDHHRRRRVRTLLGLDRTRRRELHLESRTPAHAVEQQQAERQVSEILAELRPKHREVFVLFELEHLSGEDIAERLDCPVATVRTRLFHARRAFLAVGRQHGWIELGAKLAGRSEP